jgi:hypothetical protein
MPLPTPERLAHHEAGHAVVQHWVSQGRFRVTRVALDSAGGQVAGSSLIDQEVTLGLYHFGLVTLAGIAAENRYFDDHPAPEEESWGAVGDIQEWMAAAVDVLQDKAGRAGHRKCAAQTGRVLSDSKELARCEGVGAVTFGGGRRSGGAFAGFIAGMSAGTRCFKLMLTNLCGWWCLVPPAEQGGRLA